MTQETQVTGVKEEKKILNRRTTLLLLVMQMHGTIHLKETKSIFSLPSKWPTFTNEL